MLLPERGVQKTHLLILPLSPLYSPMLSRLLWVFSPNEFCISKLIFCQNHFRLMTVVFVYPLSTLPGYVHYFPPLPLNSCQQVYRAAPLFCINCRQPQEAMQRVRKGVRGSWRQGKHKCWLLQVSINLVISWVQFINVYTYMNRKDTEGSEFHFLNSVSWLTCHCFIQQPPPVKIQQF